ncbi:MAG: transposase [Anaerolineae bacterium]|nr:transposase [Anaerolineae bacterium]
MSSKRRLYSREFKLEAIRLAETSGKMIREIEDDLGIPHGLLNKWKRKLKGEGDEAFRGQGRLTTTEEELRQLYSTRDRSGEHRHPLE